jgi:hypothetical protein
MSRIFTVALLVAAIAAFYRPARRAIVETLRKIWLTVRARLSKELLVGVAVFTSTALLSAAAYYLQIVAPDISAGSRVDWWVIDTPKRSLLVLLGVVSQVLAVLIPVAYGANATYRAITTRQAATAGEQQRQIAVNGVLMPLATVLGKLADLHAGNRNKRYEFRGEARTAVLAGLVHLLGDQAQGRACYFEVSGSAPHRILEPVLALGRANQPDNAYAEGTLEGDEAFSALDQGSARIWSRNDPGPPPPGWTSSKGYSAYISVPVATTATTHGMLTFDSPDADALTDAVSTVTLLANLLAAANSI